MFQIFGLQGHFSEISKSPGQALTTGFATAGEGREQAIKGRCYFWALPEKGGQPLQWPKVNDLWNVLPNGVLLLVLLQNHNFCFRKKTSKIRSHR